ncbi:MAG TPA: hypothetical protein VMH35_11085 [Streptosporangiaceae bacterium]|nr:hypothetical protein [Streptosporangiaceae bacterium]
MEDADFDGWCYDPPNEGFEFFLDAYRRVLGRRGGDHAIGRKLRRSDCLVEQGQAQRPGGRTLPQHG